MHSSNTPIPPPPSLHDTCDICSLPFSPGEKIASGCTTTVTHGERRGGMSVCSKYSLLSHSMMSTTTPTLSTAIVYQRGVCFGGGGVGLRVGGCASIAELGHGGRTSAGKITFTSTFGGPQIKDLLPRRVRTHCVEHKEKGRETSGKRRRNTKQSDT